MDAVTWLARLLGLGLIGVGLLDIVLTVMHIQAESPASSRLNRCLWRAFVHRARPLPAPLRDTILPWGMPLLVGTTIAFWDVCAIVGFGLLYLPDIRDPASFAADESNTLWVDAQAPSDDEVAHLADVFRLDPRATATAREHKSSPVVCFYGDNYLVTALTVDVQQTTARLCAVVVELRSSSGRTS